MGLFSGCNSSDEALLTREGPLITPKVPSSESATSFIEKRLFNTHNRSTDCFNIKVDSCHQIDSEEEFSAMYVGTARLPEIDFSRYTLLLGSKVYSAGDTDAENYKLVLSESEDCYHLDIHTRHLEDGEWAVVCITPLELFYYGIYPKLEKKKIVTKLIYE